VKFMKKFFGKVFGIFPWMFKKFGLKKKKNVSIFIVVVVAIFFGILISITYILNMIMGSVLSNYKAPAQTISAELVKTQEWQQMINTIGVIDAVEVTNISSQVPGIVSEINFNSGDVVKKGDVLFKLETQQLDAQLQQAQAQLNLAKLTNERYKKLVKQNATSKEAADKVYADFLSADANYKAIDAQIDYRTITAPFDGRIGLSHLNLGQYFQQGSTAAVLTSINPININFSVSQNDISKIHVGEYIDFESDALPNNKFRAEITAINTVIDQSSRSVQVQATYDNKNNNPLLPGMFVTVEVLLPKLENQIVLPRNSIDYTLYGESIYTLTPAKDDDGKELTKDITKDDGTVVQEPVYDVDQHKISVKRSRNNLSLVEGVGVGEMIVTSGQNKIHKGSTVVVNNDVVLNNNIYK